MRSNGPALRRRGDMLFWRLRKCTEVRNHGCAALNRTLKLSEDSGANRLVVVQTDADLPLLPESPQRAVRSRVGRLIADLYATGHSIEKNKTRTRGSREMRLVRANRTPYQCQE